METQRASVQYEAVLQSLASSLCSLSSSLMACLMTFSCDLSLPLSSRSDRTGINKTPPSVSTNPTLEPSLKPYLARTLAGIVIILFLVTLPASLNLLCTMQISPNPIQIMIPYGRRNQPQTALRNRDRSV